MRLTATKNMTSSRPTRRTRWCLRSLTGGSERRRNGGTNQITREKHTSNPERSGSLRRTSGEKRDRQNPAPGEHRDRHGGRQLVVQARHFLVGNKLSHYTKGPQFSTWRRLCRRFRADSGIRRQQ